MLSGLYLMKMEEFRRDLLQFATMLLDYLIRRPFTLKVKLIVLGELDGIINFDTKTYESLKEKPYFSSLTDLEIDFTYMSNRLRKAVRNEHQIYHEVNYDVLDTIKSGDVFFYDNHGKIRFEVE